MQTCLALVTRRQFAHVHAVGSRVRLGGDELIHAADATESANHLRVRQRNDVEKMNFIACVYDM